MLEHLVEYVEKNGWYEKYKNVLEYLYIDHVLITSINRVQKQTNEKKKIVINNLRKEVLKNIIHFIKMMHLGKCLKTSNYSTSKCIWTLFNVNDVVENYGNYQK